MNSGFKKISLAKIKKPENTTKLSIFEKKKEAPQRIQIKTLDDIHTKKEKLVIQCIPDTWSIHGKQEKGKEQEDTEMTEKKDSSQENNKSNDQNTQNDQPKKEESLDAIARRQLLKGINNNGELNSSSNLIIRNADTVVMDADDPNQMQSQIYAYMDKRAKEIDDIKEEINNLPDEPDPTGSTYSEISIEDFGLGLLRGMGYKDNNRSGKSQQYVEYHDTRQLSYRSGLGADEYTFTLNRSRVLSVNARVRITKGKNEGRMAIVKSIRGSNVTNKVLVVLDNKEECLIDKGYLQLIETTKNEEKSPKEPESKQVSPRVSSESKPDSSRSHHSPSSSSHHHRSSSSSSRHHHHHHSSSSSHHHH